MSEQFTCGTHGKQPVSYVCQHIVEAMKNGDLVGFFWAKPKGVYDAVCENCNDLSPQQWEKAQATHVTPLCLGCFKDAATQHGVALEGAG